MLLNEGTVLLEYSNKQHYYIPSIEYLYTRLYDSDKGSLVLMFHSYQVAAMSKWRDALKAIMSVSDPFVAGRALLAVECLRVIIRQCYLHRRGIAHYGHNITYIEQGADKVYAITF